MKQNKTAEYLAWEARRAECIRIGHEWKGGTCKHCGADQYGKTKHARRPATAPGSKR